MKNRTITKIIFYTILILCISAFSYFPKSYSKYIKDEIPARFFIQIDKLSISNTLIPMIRSNSTYEEVNYSVEFERSQVMKNNDTSQEISIKIEIPEGADPTACKIISVTTNGNSTINEKEANIVYEKQGTDYIIVNYKCNVNSLKVQENGEDVIYTNVNIREKFMPENFEYLYARAEGNPEKLTKYYQDYPLPETGITKELKKLTIKSSVTDKYEEFVSWLSEYATFVDENDNISKDLEYYNAITAYVNKVYQDEDDILNSSEILDGLTLTRENDSYIFEINDDFVGYARTYYSYSISQGFFKMVFSNEELSDIQANNMLQYYLKSYSGYSDDDINIIMQYVSKFGSINYVDGSINYIIKPNNDGTYNKIPGFVYLPDTKEVTLNNILQYAKIAIEEKVSIEFAGKITMLSTYINSIDLVYRDDFTPELITAIKNDTNIRNSVTKNNTTVQEKTKYSDYFVVQDTNTGLYVLVNVHSDGQSTVEVEVTELGIANSITLTQTNTDLAISITVDNQDKEVAKTNVINIITVLDNQLSTNYKDKIVDGLFTTTDTITLENITSVVNGNNITISYNITQ